MSVESIKEAFKQIDSIEYRLSVLKRFKSLLDQKVEGCSTNPFLYEYLSITLQSGQTNTKSEIAIQPGIDWDESGAAIRKGLDQLITTEISFLENKLSLWNRKEVK